MKTAYSWVISGRDLGSSHFSCGPGNPRHVDQLSSDGMFGCKLPRGDKNDQLAEENFINTHSQQQDGRFVVQLPRKANCSRDRGLRRHHQPALVKGSLENFRRQFGIMPRDSTLNRYYLKMSLCACTWVGEGTAYHNTYEDCI